MRFMRGIVMDPVETTFATVLPEIMAKKPLATTAIFAGPPTRLPATARASFMKTFRPPKASRKPAKKTKAAT